MMTLRFDRFTLCIVALSGLAAVAGCKKEEPPRKPEPAAKSAPAAEKAAPETAPHAIAKEAAGEVAGKMPAEVMTKLAEADAVDGTVDKVVSKCPACHLGMDGKSDYALEVAGYTLHFCSDACKTKFAKDPATEILALNIPED